MVGSAIVFVVSLVLALLTPSLLKSSPSVASQVAFYSDPDWEAYSFLGRAHGVRDPWGRDFLSVQAPGARIISHSRGVMPGRSTMVYSVGPNGIDEQGGGDDVVIPDPSSSPPPAVEALVLWCRGGSVLLPLTALTSLLFAWLRSRRSPRDSRW